MSSKKPTPEVEDSVIEGPGVRKLLPSEVSTASTSATGSTTLSKVQRAQELYEQLLFNADKESLQDVADANIVYIAGNDTHERPVIVLNLWKLGLHDIEHDRVLMYVAHQLDEVVEQEYVVVMTYNKDVLPQSGWLKKSYDSFAYKYKKNCKMFYILHPSTKLKITLSVLLPTLSSKATKKLKYIDCLVDLHKYMPMDRIVFPDNIYKRELSRKFSTPNRVIVKPHQMIQFYSSLLWYLGELDVARTDLSQIRDGLGDGQENKPLIEECDELLKKTATPQHFIVKVQGEVDKLVEDDQNREMTLEGDDLTALLRHIARASNGLHMVTEAVGKLMAGAKSLASATLLKRKEKIRINGAYKHGPYPLLAYSNHPAVKKIVRGNKASPKLSAGALDTHNESLPQGIEELSVRNQVEAIPVAKPNQPKGKVPPKLEPDFGVQEDKAKTRRRSSGTVVNHRGEVFETFENVPVDEEDGDQSKGNSSLHTKSPERALSPVPRAIQPASKEPSASASASVSKDKRKKAAMLRTPALNAMIAEIKDGMDVVIHRGGVRMAAHLQMDPSEEKLLVTGDGDSTETINIDGVSSWSYGFKSPTFKKQVVRMDYEWHSMTMCYKDKSNIASYLDISVSDDVSAECLLLGLYAILPASAHPVPKKSSKKHIDSLYTKGRMLWDKAAMKLRYQGEMLKMPVAKVLVQAILARAGACSNCSVALLYTPHVKKPVKVKCAVCQVVTTFPPFGGLTSEEKAGLKVDSPKKRKVIKKGRDNKGSTDSLNSDTK